MGRVEDAGGPAKAEVPAAGRGGARPFPKGPSPWPREAHVYTAPQASLGHPAGSWEGRGSLGSKCPDSSSLERDKDPSIHSSRAAGWGQ